MKNLKSITQFIIIITSLLLLHSCSDDPVSNGGNNPNVVTSLNGSINNLPSSVRIIKGLLITSIIEFIAANDTVDSNNNMNLSLAVPPEFALYRLSDIIFQLGEGIGFSDSSVKANFLKLVAFDIMTGQSTGDIVKANSATYSNEEQGNFYLTYLFIDRNVNISGTSVNIFNMDTIKYNFTLDLKTGYNKITTRLKTRRTFLKEYDLFSGEPEAANWYYKPYVY